MSICSRFFSLRAEIGASGNFPTLLYTPLPVLLWAAIRFGPRGICSAVFIITLMSIWNSINGWGPFTANTQAENVFSLQLFLIAVSIPTMLLGFLLSENKLAERALKDSEERLRMAMSAADMGTWKWDTVTNQDIRDANFNRILGLEAAESTQPMEDFIERVHPEDRAAVDQEIKRSIRERDIYLAEYRIVCPDGTEKWLCDQGLPFYDKQVKISYMTGAVVDITEHKRTDERISGINNLQEYLLGYGSLEEKLKRITNDVVKIFNADFCRIWLIKPGDLCETGCIHVRVAEGPHLCRYRDRCLHLMASSGRYTHIDGDHCRVPFGSYKIGLLADGTYTRLLTNDVMRDQRVHDHDWASNLGLVSFAGYRLLSSDGVPIGVLALFSKQKISPEEKILIESIVNTASQLIQTAGAEEALRESEEKSLLLLNSTGEAIYGLDMEGNCTFCNPSCQCLLGYEDESQLLGRNMHALIHHTRKDGTPYPEEECYIYQAFREGKSTHVDDEVLWRADGTSFASEYRSFPIFREGKTVGSVVSFVDITERIRMQEELTKSQKLESIGILAGGIAHDFNNHLQGIISTIALAKTYANPKDEIYEHLTQAEKTVLHSKGLAQQLLTFSKGGAPVMKTVSVLEIMRDSAKLALSGSNVRCEFNIQDGLWPVEADKGQLIQVIGNIIINADQAMTEGGCIKVRADNINIGTKDSLPLKEGRYAGISIEDQGTGISNEHLQKIFDPYFTTRERGSGLGLAISFSIVKKHGGHITVESEIGIGTTFCIYLPASPKKILKEPDKSKTEDVSSELVEGKDVEKATPLKGRKILFMEDDAIIRLSVTLQLRNLKYEIETAKDGTEAIELYNKAVKTCKPFDAVILDLTIVDGMGGEETIRKLLEIDPEVAAIVASGYSNDPIMTNFGEYGFKGAVEKPYEINELEEVLQKVITG